MRRLAFSLRDLSFDRICVLLSELSGYQGQSLSIHDFVVATEADEGLAHGGLLIFGAVYQWEELRGRAPHTSLLAWLAGEVTIETTKDLPAEGRHQRGSRSTRHDHGSRSDSSERQSLGTFYQIRRSLQICMESKSSSTGGGVGTKQP